MSEPNVFGNLQHSASGYAKRLSQSANKVNLIVDDSVQFQSGAGGLADQYVPASERAELQQQRVERERAIQHNMAGLRDQMLVRETERQSKKDGLLASIGKDRMSQANQPAPKPLVGRFQQVSRARTITVNSFLQKDSSSTARTPAKVEPENNSDDLPDFSEFLVESPASDQAASVESPPEAVLDGLIGTLLQQLRTTEFVDTLPVKGVRLADISALGQPRSIEESANGDDSDEFAEDRAEVERIDPAVETSASAAFTSALLPEQQPKSVRLDDGTVREFVLRKSGANKGAAFHLGERGRTEDCMVGHPPIAAETKRSHLTFSQDNDELDGIEALPDFLKEFVDWPSNEGEGASGSGAEPSSSSAGSTGSGPAGLESLFGTLVRQLRTTNYIDEHPAQGESIHDIAARQKQEDAQNTGPVTGGGSGSGSSGDR
jgi:hypothetical protein